MARRCAVVKRASLTNAGKRGIHMDLTGNITDDPSALHEAVIAMAASATLLWPIASPSTQKAAL
jgi:tagatose-1,6-bisphosphate aldolase non-catalytic subunit AgaZ/GatZ